jgi:pheromone shutdown-related protein TraB
MIASMIDAAHSILADQPIERVRVGASEVVLLGTAHVSKTSADAVSLLLEQEHFDCIAIELDEGRHKALIDPDSYKRMDLIQVFKSGRTMLVAANLALSAYQRRLAEQQGIEPGAEMLRAHTEAQQRELPLELIDRDVGITLNRCRAALGFWGGSKLITSSLLSTLSDDEIAPDEIEKLKQGDMLKATFGDFANDSPELYTALIAERDRYMAARICQIIKTRASQRMLVVIGAGHLAGIVKELQAPSRSDTVLDQTLSELNAKPKPSIWPKLIGYAITAVLVGGMIYGFSKGFDVGREVLNIYLMLSIIGGTLGALAGGAHPLSALIGGVSSPLTVLHPALSSGMFAAGVEIWRRKPTVQDFENLRDDLKNTSGWWRNRVSRTLLVFILTNFGTAIGVWITTGWIVNKFT